MLEDESELELSDTVSIEHIADLTIMAIKFKL